MNASAELYAKKYLQGETIFRAGTKATHCYLIRSGTVELSTLREGKRIVSCTLGQGDTLAELDLLAGRDHSFTATATSFVEVQSVESAILKGLLNKTPPLLRVLLGSLVKRLENTQSDISQYANVHSPIVRFATLLDLMFRGYKSNIPHRAGAYSNNKGVSAIPLEEVVTQLSELTGILPSHTKAQLQKMATLNLIAIEPGNGGRVVKPLADNISLQTKNIEQGMGAMFRESFRAEFESIEISMLADLLEIDKKLIYQKMVTQELPEDCFIFKRSEIMAIVAERGKNWFSRRRIKPVEEFDCIDDLEFVDRNTLFKVFSKIADNDIAKVLTICADSTRERILGSISNRRKDDIEGFGMMNADSIEVQEIETHIIETIKSTKLAARAAAQSN